MMDLKQHSENEMKSHKVRLFQSVHTEIQTSNVWCSFQEYLIQVQKDCSENFQRSFLELKLNISDLKHHCEKEMKYHKVRKFSTLIFIKDKFLKNEIISLLWCSFQEYQLQMHKDCKENCHKSVLELQVRKQSLKL